MELEYIHNNVYELKNENPFFVAESPSMKDLVSVLDRISASFSPILISGEYGVGKTAFAFQIFRNIKRTDKRFFCINCRASEDILVPDSSFFDGNFLYLKDISFLSEDNQKKILNFVHRVLDKSLDLKIVASTSVDLSEKVHDGLFDKELFNRFSVIPLKIKSLHERKEDIVPLARYFLKKYSSDLQKDIYDFSDAAIISLEKYIWQGNVKELELVIQRGCILENQKFLRNENLFLERSSNKNYFEDISDSLANGNENKSLKKALDNFKKEYIIKILRENDFNQTKTSKVLGIQRTYVSRLVKEFKIRKNI